MAGNSPSETPPAPGPQCSGPPRTSEYPWAREGGQSCPWPTRSAAPIPPRTSALQPSPPRAQPSLSSSLLGIQMVSTMAPRPRGGLGQGGALATPITLLAPKPPSTFLLSQCVSPASAPPLLSAARSSSSACLPCSLFTCLQLIFLGLSLPTSSSHLLLTGMSLGQRRAPPPLPLPLCARVSLSLSVL